MSTSVEGRLAALASGGGFVRTGHVPSQLDTLREFEAVSRSMPRSMSTPLMAVSSASSSPGTSADIIIDPRLRELEAKVRALKIELAEEQMRNATVIEELQDVRGQLTKSQEVLISFARRAGEDRSELERSINGGGGSSRKRMARSVPSGLMMDDGGGGDHGE
jgi:hypothetical protein